MMTLSRFFALVVCAGSLLDSSGCTRGSPRQDSLAPLVESLGGQRQLEPRLTGGFAYSPCQYSPPLNLQRSRCADRPQKISPNAVALAISKITKPKVRARAEAIANLIAGTAEGVNRATQKLEDVARGGDDAKVLSDLAATYLERACRSNAPYDLVRALTAVERAVKADPRLPEALFNRALVLERLHLRVQAEEAWDRYRTIDHDTGWSREASRHASNLSAPQTAFEANGRSTLERAAAQGDKKFILRWVTTFPQAARELAMNELLANWGESWKAGHMPSAVSSLNTAREIGEALREIGGDRMVADAVSAIDQAATKPSFTDALAQAHVAYGAATRLFRELSVEAAGIQFREAREEFLSSGSPMVMWADCGLGGVEMSRHRYEAALVAFAGLANRVDRHLYPALYGRISWGIGLARGRQGKLTEALGRYRDAEVAFGTAHEIYNELTVESMSAEGLKLLGQDEPAWTYRYRALATLTDIPAGRQLHNLLWEAADDLIRSGQAAPSEDFQEEDVRVARWSKDPFMIAEALHRRARILAALGRGAEALRDIDEARAINASGTSEVTRATTAADIDRAEGEIRLPSDPRGAAVFLTRAIESFHKEGRPAEEILCRLSRARADIHYDRDIHLVRDLHLHLEREAEGDLETSLALVENGREAIQDVNFRESYSEAAQSFFDEMILLQAETRRDPVSALAMVERARGVPGDGGTRPAVGVVFWKERSIRLSRIPANVALVEYALSGDRLLVWMLWRGGMEFVDRKILPRDFAGQVQDFNAAVRSGSDQSIASTSAPIYSELIPPCIESLPGSVQLVFAPDRFLNGVPFAALRNPRTKRYFVEERASTVVPSLAFYLTRSASRSTGGRQHWSALLVSNPAFDRGLFPLADLPGATAEVDEVGKLYAKKTMLSGREATRSRLLAELDRHEAFVFAGHAVFNPHDPEDSYLVTAPESSDRGTVVARDIAKLRFHCLQLVVLSACHTSAATNQRIGGLSGLARPFIDAGAVAVLATLWDINDDVDGPLSSQFHRRFRESGDAALALRFMQIYAIHSSLTLVRSPSNWAAFQVVGASSNAAIERKLS